MLVLWKRDKLRVQEIGEPLNLDSATLTPLLKRLETAPLIRRVRSTEDERSVLVSLAAVGRALKKRAQTVPSHVLCAVFAPSEQASGAEAAAIPASAAQALASGRRMSAQGVAGHGEPM